LVTSGGTWTKIGCARPGIGQAVAIVFAQAGASIAAFDVQDTSETVELAKKEGVEAKGWTLDARNEEAVSTAIDQVEKDLGPIHVLVNLAGIVGSRPILMENYKNIMNTMEINFGGVRISSNFQ
jgi:NAD(P)-dependent dehydrogenase (short-subunit alcohol dehydrogenase family)